MQSSKLNLEGYLGKASCPCGKDIADGEFRLITIMRNFASEFCRECVDKGLHLSH